MSEHTIPDLIEATARRGDHPAIIHLGPDGQETLTCAALARNVRALAGGLVAAGVAPGENVALIGPNTPRWIVAALALWSAGATVVPIDELLQDEAEQIVRALRCRRIFTTCAHAAALAPRLADAAPTFVLLDAETDPVSAPGTGIGTPLDALAHGDGVPPRLAPDAPAACLATSGTTGASKLFVLTHRNVMTNVRALAAMGIVGRDDRALLPLPFHHAYPIVVGILTPLAAGTAIVIPQAITGPEIVRALREAETTVIIGVPRLYETMLAGIRTRAAQRGRFAGRVLTALMGLSIRLQRRTGLPAGRLLLAPLRRTVGPRLRLLVSGGAHLEAAVARQLEALGWMVLSGYGLAETSSVFTCNRPEARRAGSAGRPFADGKVRIARPDESGLGEVELHGSSITAGYLDNPEANRAAFTDDGWFRTGDLGRLDDDGYLVITGRSKDVIVLGGARKVDPEALEKTYGADPRIREIAFLQHGEALVALVVPEIPRIRELGVTRAEDAIRVAVAETARRLPGFQRPAGFAIVTAPLPRTRLGKLRRFLLPDIYARAKEGAAPTGPRPPESEADRALLAHPVAGRARAALERHFAGRDWALDASLDLDLGLDSFERMVATLEIERATGIHLDAEDMAAAETVRDLLQAVAAASERKDGQTGAAAGPDAARWLRPPGPLLRALGVALHALNRAALRLLLPLRIEGAEHLPGHGPFVIAPNHASDLDPLVLAAVLPRPVAARAYWAADTVRVFGSAAGRLLGRAVHLFPVDERRPGDAIGIAAEVLARGDIQVWFPEAWRSPDGRLQRFLPGVGALLGRSGAPVVPALIEGTFEAMPRDRRWPRRHPVAVRFGAPVEPGTLEAEGTGDTPEQRIADGLRRRVAALKGGNAPQDAPRR